MCPPGVTYSMQENPPTDPTITSRLVKRSDDTPTALKTRLTIFNQNLPTIIALNNDVVKRVNATNMSQAELLDVCVKFLAEK